jgi:5-hydroxyisourate hydrolase-like protein (transthyretin family)
MFKMKLEKGRWLFIWAIVFPMLLIFSFDAYAANTVTVTSPNGGEVWPLGLTQTIRWTYSGTPGANVKIELYRGYGFSKLISASTPIGNGGSGSYSWPVPSWQTVDSSYSIKITSTSNSAYKDASDGKFTITNATTPPPTTPTITVSSPNGGETWQQGSTQTVRWSYTGNPGTNVKVELLKGGAVNSVLSSSASIGSGGSGSYSWTVPSSQVLGTDYQVRVTSTSNSAYTDTSNSNFSITSTSTPTTSKIIVSSPNGGESWQLGSAQTIRWTYTGTPGSNVKIELYRGYGLSKVISASTPIGSGSYTWTVPSWQTVDSSYTIKITSTSNVNYTDSSDGKFTITNATTNPTPTITVTSPNGGESWQVGSTQMIKWSYAGNPGSAVKIELLKAGVVNQTINSSTSIGSNGSGSYSWAIPSLQAAGGDYKIRVSSTSNGACADTSDNQFTITNTIPSAITVSSPNGGENWQVGSTQTIRWTYTGNPGSAVKIELLKAGVVNQTISSSTSIGSNGSGSFAWTVPSSQVVGSDYKIKINNASSSAYSDESNSNFNITSSPNLPPRGIAGDFWADVEVGRRDFAEIVPNEVVPSKLFKPEGVFIDRSVSPGLAYIWDSGNSRLLGLDLGRCYEQKRTSPSSPCTAELVFGQPSGNDYGACNQDSSFQTYPNRSESSASTLCGISERTHTVREDGTAVHMDMDSEGNLYVPDALNNRVLKFIRPWETDTVADEVWGQEDFRGNLCNRNGNTYGPWHAGPPTDSTLCYCSAVSCGMAVALDPDGNLWVVDGGNNRVLRFPKNSSTGVISKTADLILGRPDFYTGGDSPGGSGLNQMNSPLALSFDKQGKLYVADRGNFRILVFASPFQSGMSASYTFGSGFSGEGRSGPVSVKVDTDPDNPNGQIVWTSENHGWDAMIRIWNMDGTLRKTLPTYHQATIGQLGIDRQGNVLYTVYGMVNDLFAISQELNGDYRRTELFSPPVAAQNQISGRRLGAPAWVGVAAVSNQLVVGDGRLLFWNNPPNLGNGQSPDGYVGTSSPTEFPPETFGFYYLKADAQNRVWVSRNSEIWVYQAPLTVGAQSIKIIKGPIPVLGGGEIRFGGYPYEFLGLVPSSDGKFLWVSQTDQNRVLRIRDPLTNPVVDVVLGQTDLTGNQCNRGVIREHGPNPELNMLCYPGALSIDKRSNLYISDNMIELRGNNRVLLFPLSLFPDNPSSVIFAPNATKEFSTDWKDWPGGSGEGWTGEMFEPAFDSANRMVAGYNPYSGARFLGYYNDPARLNSSGSPKDISYAIPDGLLKDYYGWPIAMTFDQNDNLYAYDANRGRVLIYKNPFNN